MAGESYFKVSTINPEGRFTFDFVGSGVRCVYVQDGLLVVVGDTGLTMVPVANITGISASLDREWFRGSR